MTDQSADIVVIGAGTTGLVFAIAARQLGYEVTVVDRKTKPDMPVDQSANVIALNVTSTDCLSDLQVFQQIPSAYRPAYNRMQVFDGNGVGSVSFDAADAGYTVLGHIVDQRALLFALVSRAEQVGVNLAWQSSFDVATEQPDLLVAADGAHSTTREQLGFKKVRYDYHQSGIARICSIK